LIKKTSLEEYKNTKKTTGLQAIKFKDGDELAGVTFLKDEEVMMITEKGYSIRFKTKSITPTGRVTSGVKGIKLTEGDKVVIGLPIKHKEENLAIITSSGMGKMTPISEYTIQARGGKGILTFKPSPLTATIAGAAIVENTDELLLIGTPSSICISASDIPVLSRTGTGNNMIKNSKVNRVVKL